MSDLRRDMEGTGKDWGPPLISHEGRPVQSSPMRFSAVEPGTVPGITPDEYQRLAMRTRCDQHDARKRMSGAAGPGFEYLDRQDWIREEGGGTANNLVPVQLNHAALGLAGEAGELGEIVMKWLYYAKQWTLPEVQALVKEECGDALWFIAEALEAVGLKMSDVMAANIAKLRTRFPHQFDPARHAAKDRAAEAEALKAGAPITPTVPMHDGEPVDDGKRRPMRDGLGTVELPKDERAERARMLRDASNQHQARLDAARSGADRLVAGTSLDHIETTVQPPSTRPPSYGDNGGFPPDTCPADGGLHAIRVDECGTGQERCVKCHRVFG